MLRCIKQYLSNIWSSVHEKGKQRWGWVEKSIAYKKSRISLERKTQVITFEICTKKTKKKNLFFT